MHSIDVEVSCPVFDSFRVRQVAGMFDVPVAERARERFRASAPDPDDDWRIGLIVGPSAGGKTAVARKLFGDAVYQSGDWPRDRAVVDCVGELPIKRIVRLFTAVGFSSPPSWIKPYHVLSGGERFRCDLARALAGSSAFASSPLVADNVVVFDEFTSVVDRSVARVISMAVAKAVRQGWITCRFVAVTCHYDVTEWLTPDWVLDTATSRLERRCLRRPGLRIEVFRCRRSAWNMFRRHHYLTGSLSPSARCFLAVWSGVPVAFCASVTLIGRKGRWRISRIVTLPDYQGVGIGMGLMEAVAKAHRREGHRVNVTAGHPAVIAHCRRSPRWRAVGVRKIGSRATGPFLDRYRGSAGRAVVSFEFVEDG